MKLRKSQLAALLLIVLALALGACMNSNNQANTPDATIDPFSGVPTTTGQSAVNATAAPARQDQPAGEQMGDAGQMNAPGQAAQRFDWAADAAAVENRVGQISEISECRIVVSGDTALVGVRFTPQYKGEMTERIREMIAGQVKAADSSIQTVAVTANEEDTARIFEISDSVKSGQSIDEMDSDIDSIVRNATTMR